MTRSSAPRSVPLQVTEYLAAQAERKRGDLTTLHAMMLRLMPGARLWFLDGKDEDSRDLAVLEAAGRDGITRTSA